MRYWHFIAQLSCCYIGLGIKRVIYTQLYPASIFQNHYLQRLSGKNLLFHYFFQNYTLGVLY